MAVPSEIPTPKTRTMDRCASFAHSHCGGSPSGPAVVQEYQYPAGSRATAHRTSGTVYKTAVATPALQPSRQGRHRRLCPQEFTGCHGSRRKE